MVLVTFSIPLQVHPCRASLDAVLNWRPNGNSRSQTGSPGRPSSSASQALLPAPNASGGHDHGSLPAQMSDMRFAAITTVILVLSYATALTVDSLDRVLAYVGSTGSTAISFILPGLFYYKISDPDSQHHQRLSKEDDDVDFDSASDPGLDDDELGLSSSRMFDSTTSLASNISATGSRLFSRWRKKWRWDLEHLETGLLRKLALCLAMYGICVMVVCLGMNTFAVVTH